VEEQIHFSNDQGETLIGSLHRPETEAEFGMVLGHCFTCSRHTQILRRIAEELAAAGFMALRFDFSGNGQSDGIFADSTYSKQLSEMQTAAGIMAAHNATCIALAGHSLGAAMALLAADRIESVRGVCTLAGRLSGTRPWHFLNPEQRRALEQSGTVDFTSRGRSLQLSHDFFADADQFDLPSAVKRLTKPLLIVHGEADDIISVREAYRAHGLNAQQTELAIIAGADHMFSRAADRELVATLVTRFVQRLKLH
jgi:putative redox protein